ncbi:MAG TPA: CHAT domain-containing protein [Kofleriaceae bacterium]|jgi:tetratricopeptide (TPR) repeat protein|nr:CHAT domain-containing protein [Kofleriaceae bacterium]
MSECSELARTHALADGELNPAEAEAARAHLATCKDCQAELDDVMQLDALPAPRRDARVISLAWYRRRSTKIGTIGVIALAAAGVAFVWWKRPVPAPQTTTLALASNRALEPRLAWRDASAYRPYDVPRGSRDAPHETIPLGVLGDIERSGDLHGVGVLAMLDGERKQAASYLDRAGDAPDVIDDRAALALVDGHADRALALCDDVLARTPDDPVAHWNRGLALRDLGLTSGAAAEFRAVATRNEPGWSDEARRRADVLDAEASALAQRFARLNHASVALASGSLEMTVDDARAEPGYARGILYDAIRSAPSHERLAALEPLANAIDASDHDTALHDAIARASAALHPELAKRYGELIATLSVESRLTQPTGHEIPLPIGTARMQLFESLRAAHADDLLIGLLVKLSTDRATVDDRDLAELVKLTAASPDPWMQMFGIQQQAQVALRGDDLIGAEAVLLRGRARCMQGAPALRCILIGKLLGQLYLRWQRVPEARATLADAFSLARRAGESFLQTDLIQLLANLAVVDSDAEGVHLPLVRAYTDELVRRFPEGADDWKCQTAAFGRMLRANVLVNLLRFDDARRELAGPACASTDDPGIAANMLFTRAELAQHSGAADEIAAVRADAAALRAKLPASSPERARVDHAEGRVLIDRDPAAGEALLRRSIAEADTLPPSAVNERRPAAWSYAVLAIAAAKRGDGAAALAVLADEQKLALPATCVVGLAVNDERRAIVARDAAGKLITHYDAARTSPAIDAATFIPADVRAALASCPEVDVIARPPLHGTSRLFGDDVAWRYLSRRAAPVGAASSGSIAIADAEPPAALELPRLQTWVSDGQTISGPAATPSRVLAAIGAAGEVIVHAHGLVDVAEPDASYLALSPDADGKFALTTGDVRKAHFASSPLVILAACRGSLAAPIFHDTWSLPAAFVFAGARAVIASAAPIPDADASAFFDAVRAKIHAGAAIPIAVRDARREWLNQGRGEWVRDVIVFE